mgnify:CR=1 FL=1
MKHLKKAIIGIAVAASVLGSTVAAAADDIATEYNNPVTFDAGLMIVGKMKDPRIISENIQNLVEGGYIKPKEGVKIIFKSESGYVVLNEKTGSHFMLTNDGISPISIKGKRVDNLSVDQKHSMYEYGRTCQEISDKLKKTECVMNFAATL